MGYQRSHAVRREQDGSGNRKSASRQRDAKGPSVNPTTQRILELQRTAGNAAVVQALKADPSLQRETLTAKRQKAKSRRKKKHELITFGDTEVFGIGTGEKQETVIRRNVDEFLSAYKSYMSNFRQSASEAGNIFATSMFHETEKTAEFNWGPVLTEVLKEGLKKIVEHTFEEIPGAEVVVDAVFAVYEEMEASAKRKVDSDLAGFVIGWFTEMGQKLQGAAESANLDSVLEKVRKSDYPLGTSEKLRRLVPLLSHAPTNARLLAVMSEKWVQGHHELGGQSTSLSGFQWHGILDLRYVVDDDGKPDLDEATFAIGVEDKTTQFKRILPIAYPDGVDPNLIQVDRRVAISGRRGGALLYFLRPEDRTPEANPENPDKRNETFRAIFPDRLPMVPTAKINVEEGVSL